MKALAAILFSVILVSCQDISLDQIQEASEKALIVDSMQGTYSACNATAHPSFWREDVFTVSGNNVIHTINVTNDSACASHVYEYVAYYSVDYGAYFDKASGIANLGFRTTKVELTTITAFQVNRDYCGFTDWVAGVKKDVTGLSCPTLLASDPFHSSTRAAGEFEYMQLTIAGSNLSLSTGFSESGDDLANIKVSDLDVLSK